MGEYTQMDRRSFLGKTAAVAAASAVWTKAPVSGATPETKKSGDEGSAPPAWRIGCWTRPWAKYDYRVAMDAIAEAGFRYISFTGAKTKTRRVIAPGTTLEESQRAGEEARRRGLTLTYVYGGGLPLHKGPADLRKMIDNCAAAKGEYVVISRIGAAEHLDHNCRVIAGSCDYAAEKKVGLVLKPHGGLNATGALCRRAIEKVGHDNFTLLYDPGNVRYYSDGKIDPLEDVAATGGFVTGMSVKDYKHPKEVGLTPGTGEIDFPALMRRLKENGFTHGPLVIECLTSRGSAKETIQEAVKARRFVESLVGV